MKNEIENSETKSMCRLRFDSNRQIEQYHNTTGVNYDFQLFHLITRFEMIQQLTSMIFSSDLYKYVSIFTLTQIKIFCNVDYEERYWLDYWLILCANNEQAQIQNIERQNIPLWQLLNASGFFYVEKQTHICILYQASSFFLFRNYHFSKTIIEVVLSGKNDANLKLQMVEWSNNFVGTNRCYIIISKQQAFNQILRLFKFMLSC
ncbi:hypothetical protein ABPG74_021413 [Tetrahymena malaccensis]